ncbi:DUF1183-domain-containing protein [Xylona heveae TC161]|uniref:Store-operated calcium entry-associated regulatory factor n=1 Tax=Xylona heveae (strain CBS 132557 / TC161) TaxID=1328760 RepID=A0A164ZJK0_XYLHT|nr:DUF1183-domain-containing protein [Xylona heveae TC161]KZF19179.1 DUF1183-domain-containing protein [Xylona heveae TC161]
MHLLDFLYPALLTVSAVAPTVEATRKPNLQSVRLTDIKSLTLRKDRMTAHRRVAAIPQLNCIGGDAQGLYDIDILRCINAGTSYDNDDVEWTCTASLPDEFKLGSTDVICEGYHSPDDPFILKGSCGVEYRLLLTDKGEEKYGHGRGDNDGRHGRRDKGSKWPAIGFWAIFLTVFGWIVYNAYIRRPSGPQGGAAPGGGPGYPWGGGGGGGGGGPGDDNDDPPPPYDYPGGGPRKAGQAPNSASAPRGAGPGSQQGGWQGWRPGFWTGALGGAAAGYFAGNRGRNNGNGSTYGFHRYGTGGNAWHGTTTWWNNGRHDDPWEGSAGPPGGRSGFGSGSGSGPSSFSSTRHESTGFGSTSRR